MPAKTQKNFLPLTQTCTVVKTINVNVQAGSYHFSGEGKPVIMRNDSVKGALGALGKHQNFRSLLLLISLLFIGTLAVQAQNPPPSTGNPQLPQAPPPSRTDSSARKDSLPKTDSAAVRTDSGAAKVVDTSRKRTDTAINGNYITGIVTDVNGAPVTGATVSFQGKAGGGSTDSSGHYSVPGTGTDILVISSVGSKTQQVPVGGRKSIDIRLERDSKALGEVVVTALGIRKNRRALGYSVTEVAGKSLTEARENNVVNGLEGKIAGVNVSQVASGPGSSSNVVIRGASSITGSSQPLYVVDGVPINNDNNKVIDTRGFGGYDGGDGIGNINPDDIESVSVLKGAAASALYGYRGSKGVILITTKNGKQGKGLGVEWNSNYVVEKVIDYTHFQKQYGQGLNNVAPASQDEAIQDGLQSWGGALDGTPVYQFDGTKKAYSPVSDNLHRFYGDGHNFTNTVSLSKSFGDDGGARFSFNDVQDKSIIPNAGLDRKSFLLNLTYNLDKHLRIDIKGNYILQHVQNNPVVADPVANVNYSAMFTPPNINIKDLSPGTVPEGYYNSDYKPGYELPYTGDPFVTNPYFAAYKFQNNVFRNRFIGMGSLKYTFDNGLYLQYRMGEDFYLDKISSVTPTGTAYSTGGSYSDNTYKSTELNIDALAGKDFHFAKNITLTGTVGANYRKVDIENQNTIYAPFNTPFLYVPGNGKVIASTFVRPRVLNQSLYATVDFNFKDILYINATGRNDWYSTLAPGKINYFYPSANASFVFSELLHSKTLTFGKIRIGYADVGGEADKPYQTLLNYNTIATINGMPVANIVNNATIPNPNLQPSSAREFEIGTELAFLDNRLKFDGAVYEKKITRSIVPATIAQTSGYTSVYLNIGELRNKGAEALITGVPIQHQKFSWTVTLNGSYNNNRVISLSPEIQSLILASSQVSSDQGTNPVIAQFPKKSASQIVAFDPERDAKGNAIIDPALGTPDPAKGTFKPMGSGIHPWGAGINNDFHFGALNVSFLIDGKWGGKIFSGTNGIAMQNGLLKSTTVNRLGTFGDGSDGNTYLAQDYYYNLSTFTSQFVYDASFIKLRQVIIGYNFPTRWIGDWIQGLSLSVVARNPLILMKHTPNIDPESNYSSLTGQGLELAGSPPVRSFGLNLNVKF